MTKKQKNREVEKRHAIRALRQHAEEHSLLLVSTKNLHSNNLKAAQECICVLAHSLSVSGENVAAITDPVTGVEIVVMLKAKNQ